MGNDRGVCAVVMFAEVKIDELFAKQIKFMMI
jgi:hypothetical protein